MIAVILIIGLFALKGHRIGFIKTLFSMFSLIIVLVLTINISPVISKTIQNNDKIKQTIVTKVKNAIDNDTKGESGNKSKNKVDQELSRTEQNLVIEAMPLPKSIKTALVENNNSEVYKVLVVSTFEDYIINYITCIIINSISFAVTFAVIGIILSIIVNAINLISKLPILNGINKTAGLLLGILEGFIVIWLLCIVLTMFSTTDMGKSIYLLINESVFLSTIYDNNYLLSFIISITRSLF